jgi:hypothetical protein
MSPINFLTDMIKHHRSSINTPWQDVTGSV